MLRIMDVASALRRERETAEAQLDAATAKQRLRERLLATAEAAGEPVTAAEVEAAINRYFAEQHRYQDPPAGLKNFLAHCWVQREGCLFLLIFVALVSWGVVALLESVGGGGTKSPTPAVITAPPVPRQPVPAPTPTPTPLPTPPTAQPTPVVVPAPAPPPKPVEDLASVWAKFSAELAAAQQLADDDEAKASVAMVGKLGTAQHAAGNLERLRAARSELAEVTQRLGEEYTVTIVDRPGEKSGFQRLYEGRVSGWYLVVEALDRNGRALRRSIVNVETKNRHDVTIWGEEVPEEVWERIVADKQRDGVVDENVVARKRRGSMSEAIVLDDGRGKPMPKGRRVTSW